VFSEHSLATDGAFAEVQLVSCRNVLIYFDDALRDRALAVLRESLCPGGFLGLGLRETLKFSAHASAFSDTLPAARIYRKAR
jgi:chemotaxis protein methyltransferase CheR